MGDSVVGVVVICVDSGELNIYVSFFSCGYGYGYFPCSARVLSLGSTSVGTKIV